MTPRALLSSVRRRWPRRLRTRLAVFYALLFLLAGAALLALTYAAARYLLPGPGPWPRAWQHLTAQEQRLIGVCGQLPNRGVGLHPGCAHLVAVLGRGPNPRSEVLGVMRQASGIGLVALVLAAAGLGWLAAGRALQPVRSLTEAARRASELRLGQRVALEAPNDELKQLADTFDVMLDRLDAAFTSQKRFVANAAHELRSPLARVRTAVEVTFSKPTRAPEQLEAMADRIMRSVDRAEATVEALLTLATSELGPTAHETIDLATVAEDALDATQPAIDQRQITVEAALAPAQTHGDRILLERMIANLVENAIRHNDDGGWIAVRTSRQNGSAVVEIANTGPSVAADQIPTLFEPFARADQRLNHADGVGLGLSIANAIAGAHHATITARPRPDGGLDMSVTIPSNPR